MEKVNRIRDAAQGLFRDTAQNTANLHRMKKEHILAQISAHCVMDLDMAVLNVPYTFQEMCE